MSNTQSISYSVSVVPNMPVKPRLALTIRNSLLTRAWALPEHLPAMLHYATASSSRFLNNVLGYHVKVSNRTVLAGLRLYPVSYVIIQDLTLHIRQFFAKMPSIIPNQAICVS